MKSKVVILLITSLIITLIGCNRQFDEFVSYSAPTEYKQVEAATDLATTNYTPVSENSTSESNTSSNNYGTIPEDMPLMDRKIIKNAQLSFESENPKENVQTLIGMVGSSGGYVISNTQNKYGEINEYSLVFKIPATRFETFMSEVEKVCGVITSKTITSDDVSEEFYDNEAQLKAKKELELRYLNLIKQAKTVKDLVELEEKLSEVRSAIETITGRQRFLTNNTKYSTFHISIRDLNTTLSDNYGHQIFKSFKNSIHRIGNFFLWCIELFPTFILIGMVVWGLYRILKVKNICNFKFQDKTKKSDNQ